MCVSCWCRAVAEGEDEFGRGVDGRPAAEVSVGDFGVEFGGLLDVACCDGLSFQVGERW